MGDENWTDSAATESAGNVAMKSIAARAALRLSDAGHGNALDAWPGCLVGCPTPTCELEYTGFGDFEGIDLIMR